MDAQRILSENIRRIMQDKGYKQNMWQPAQVLMRIHLVTC